MMLLWKHALESNKAILLDEIDLGPDALLTKVEEFEGISQATEHSYPALVMSSEDGSSNSISTFEDDSHSENFSEDDMYSDDEYYDSESFEELETSAPPGSLSIDLIAEKLDKKWKWKKYLSGVLINLSCSQGQVNAIAWQVLSSSSAECLLCVFVAFPFCS